MRRIGALPAGFRSRTCGWCHGNAGNIVNRLDNLRFLFRQNLSVFLFDYRGYGKSQNVRPSEEGLYQDAIGAYEYLVRVRRLKPERLIIFGRSLGAAVAADLASRKPAAGLILESITAASRSIGSSGHNFA
jgi:pimeloyl-ACP methyl ester carboxylesterase